MINDIRYKKKKRKDKARWSTREGRNEIDHTMGVLTVAAASRAAGAARASSSAGRRRDETPAGEHENQQDEPDYRA